MLGPACCSTRPLTRLPFLIDQRSFKPRVTNFPLKVFITYSSSFPIKPHTCKHTFRGSGRLVEGLRKDPGRLSESLLSRFERTKPSRRKFNIPLNRTYLFYQMCGCLDLYRFLRKPSIVRSSDGNISTGIHSSADYSSLAPLSATL